MVASMDSMLAWGLDIVRLTQRAATPALTFLMKGFTALGSEWFYFAILPLVYWCVDRRRGARLGLVFFVSSFLNLWLKDLCAQPRPYELDPKLGMAHEASYGLPSGHAQGTTVFWGLVARDIARPWGVLLAVFLPLVVGVSRVYLGVHFPTDVFAGWALGLVILAADAVLGERAERGLARLDLRVKAGLVAAIAFAMNALDMRDTSVSGAFFGVGLGFVFAPRLAAFSAKGQLAQRLLRYILGLAVAACLYVGLKAVFPGAGSELYALFRFVRYGALGAWVSLGAPWVFLRLGLAEREAT